MKFAGQRSRPRATVSGDPRQRPTILVLAGTNGAGKSSVGGEALRRAGARYFNPDEVTRQLRESEPGLTLERANSLAWLQGKRLLEQAIDRKLNFSFETTLGGNTITALLERASEEGLDVRIWYVGLASPELHIARVRARVAKGGHAIPEAKIRERYKQSRTNLIRLLPGLASLHLYDNSAEGGPGESEGFDPRLILHVEEGRIVESCPLTEVPRWARPIVLSALRLSRRQPDDD